MYTVRIILRLHVKQDLMSVTVFKHEGHLETPLLRRPWVRPAAPAAPPARQWATSLP